MQVSGLHQLGTQIASTCLCSAVVELGCNAELRCFALRNFGENVYRQQRELADLERCRLSQQLLAAQAAAAEAAAAAGTEQLAGQAHAQLEVLFKAQAEVGYNINTQAS